jgi:hypothetical protein
MRLGHIRGGMSCRLRPDLKQKALETGNFEGTKADTTDYHVLNTLVAALAQTLMFIPDSEVQQHPPTRPPPPSCKQLIVLLRDVIGFQGPVTARRTGLWWEAI